VAAVEEDHHAADMLDPLDDELAEAYVRHMDAAYQAGRSDGRAGGFAEGLALGIALVALALVLLWL
jgi:hypothetical protein